MKKVLVVFLVLVIILSMSGCSVKKKIENKIGEAIGEKIIEGATGQNVDVQGDKVTIKGEDGSKLTLGGGEWPKNDLIKNIPEFKGGKIESTMSTEESVVMSLESVEQKDFEKYLENIKKDFTEDAFEMNSDEVISYAGLNEKSVQVQLTYEIENKSLSIVVAKTAE
ncbi:MAG TPA: hypothetical protein GXZ27_00735 [Thermoanaerobacterales bacterium]|jgi:hypothetical protein|nr:hypothetical protein [Thermoanaerobacterales bacterium]